MRVLKLGIRGGYLGNKHKYSNLFQILSEREVTVLLVLVKVRWMLLLPLFVYSISILDVHFLFFTLVERR